MTLPRKHLFLRLTGVSCGLALAVAVLSAASSIFAGGGVPAPGADGTILSANSASPGGMQWIAAPGGGNALTSSPLSQFAATTSAQLAGVITDETGTGFLVFGTSPTLTTPVLGVATATSINKMAITAPATSSTLAVADGKTATISNTLTFTGTDSSSVAFGAGGTVLYNGGALGTPSSGTLTNVTGLPEAGLSLTDITTNNASTSKHGFLIKGDNNASHCLNGQIAWVACAVGATSTFYQTLDSQTNVFADSPVTVGSSKGIYYCNAASGNITYNLPAVAGAANWIFTLVKIDSSTNSCTLDGSGVEPINGASTYAINSQYSGVTIHTTGSTGWTSLMTAGVSFPDPLADKILYFQNSSKSIQPVTVGSNLSFSGGTLDATVGASSTNTFTNKTLDVEATGNVVSMPFYMLFNTAACQGTTASNGFNIQASGNATVACNGSTIIQGILTFPDASTTEVQVHIVLPADWDSALTTDLVGKWRTSATSGNVVWQVSGKCMADGVVIPTSYNSTADTVTDAAKGTTLQANTFTLALSTASNHALNGCSAGDDLYMRFFRDPSNGSDTLGADADLLSLALRYRRTM